MGRRLTRRFAGAPGPTGPVVVGLETGGDHLAVALWRLPAEPGTAPDRWRLLEDAASHRGHRHAQALLPMLDEMLTRQELTPADIALIGVDRGPGGFTGVRVGMATALGLSLGQTATIWPVDSLAALACHAAGVPGVAVPLLDARKGEVYGAPFRVGADGVPSPLWPARVGPHSEVLAAAREAAGDEPLHVFGSGAQVYECATVVPPTWHAPSASHAGWLAAHAWEAAGRDASAAPAFDPAYVRASDAELAQAAQRPVDADPPLS